MGQTTPRSNARIKAWRALLMSTSNLSSESGDCIRTVRFGAREYCHDWTMIKGTFLSLNFFIEVFQIFQLELFSKLFFIKAVVLKSTENWSNSKLTEPNWILSTCLFNSPTSPAPHLKTCLNRIKSTWAKRATNSCRRWLTSLFDTICDLLRGTGAWGWNRKQSGILGGLDRHLFWNEEEIRMEHIDSLLTFL